MAWRTLVAATPLAVHEGKLLMIRERRPSGTWWSVPGGYADAGESLEEAAAREAEEETGVAVSVGALVCTLVWDYPAKPDVVTPPGSERAEYVFRPCSRDGGDPEHPQGLLL